MRFTRYIILGALAIGLSFTAQAATMTPVGLSPLTYTDLGPGPMTLGAANGNVLYQQSTAQPILGSPNLVLQSGGQPAQFTGVAHVWALGSSAATVALVTTGADVFAPPGGGNVNPPTVYSTQLSCSGAMGSAVAMPSQALVNGIVIKAGKANTGTIYVGQSGTTPSTGYPLSAGEAISYGATNLSAVFYVCTVVTDSIAITGN